jgi:hypothetical protein
MKIGIAVLACVCVAIGALTGAAFAGHTPVRVDQVNSFNDGFATAKSDDCQLGDTTACDWLNGNQ